MDEFDTQILFCPGFFHYSYLWIKKKMTQKLFLFIFFILFENVLTEMEFSINVASTMNGILQIYTVNDKQNIGDLKYKIQNNRPGYILEGLIYDNNYLVNDQDLLLHATFGDPSKVFIADFREAKEFMIQYRELSGDDYECTVWETDNVGNLKEMIQNAHGKIIDSLFYQNEDGTIIFLNDNDQVLLGFNIEDKSYIDDKSILNVAFKAQQFVDIYIGWQWEEMWHSTFFQYPYCIGYQIDAQQTFDGIKSAMPKLQPIDAADPPNLWVYYVNKIDIQFGKKQLKDRYYTTIQPARVDFHNPVKLIEYKNNMVTLVEHGFDPEKHILLGITGKYEANTIVQFVSQFGRV